MTVEAALRKLANGQRDLYKLAKQILKDDKADGVRWTNWMDKHDSLLREMIDDARLHADIEGDESEALETLINE